MSALRAQLEKAQATFTKAQRAFDGRVRRERLLLIGAAIAVGVMAIDHVWLTPAFNAWKATRARHALAADAMQRLNQDISERGAQLRANEQQLQRELVLWREKVQQGDAELRAFGTSLVNAADMLPVLDHMLAQVGGLRVRSMQSLARTELATAGPAAAGASMPSKADSGPALYRHGVELTVEGSYADLLAYLRALEAMPQRLLWGGVQMKVEQYPKVVLTLRLYTLSMNRGWLEL